MMNQNGRSSMVAYHHRPQNHVVSKSPIPIHYMRDSWIQRERLLHMLPGNPNFSLLPDTSASNSMHIMQPTDLPKEPLNNNGVGRREQKKQGKVPPYQKKMGTLVNGQKL
ncbi:hypothetical protein L2E82_01053 [Cichorium intybus]|uniref:Uncharacterized protein n=1 Tax=Cichorium intybus TaxID=13427 RepID=A0ACB9GYM5_CICIN|nr:hypothetical protein L2E82_01053 [Cichorium intybus]